MSWFRSEFIEYPLLIVEHVFVCGKCGVSRTRRVITAEHNGPVSTDWLMRDIRTPASPGLS